MEETNQTQAAEQQQQPQEENVQKDQKIALVFVCGLCGIGKSSLLSKAVDTWKNKYNLNVYCAESDTFRQSAMKEEKEKPESAALSPRSLELKSKPLYYQHLLEGSARLVEELANIKGNNVFILDKNYVNEEVRANIFKAARKHCKSVSSFLILPHQSKDPELAIVRDGKQNWFHLDTLAVSLVRSFSRKGHKSLCHGYSHALKSIVGCLNSFYGVDMLEICERYDMKVLDFDYFEPDVIIEEVKKEETRKLIETILPLGEHFEEEVGDNFHDELFKVTSLIEKATKRIDRSEQAEQISITVAETLLDD